MGEWTTKLRGTALFYGRASLPYVVSDSLEPGALSESSTHYRVTAATGEKVERYALSSIVGSNGVPAAGEAASAASAAAGKHGDYIAMERVLGVPARSTVLMTLRISADADFVLLRRLVDRRHSVQRARVRVDGVEVALWLSPNVENLLFNTSWRFEDMTLPRRVTRGKTRIRVRLDVESDDDMLGKKSNRTYPPGRVGALWTEARWEVLCFFAPPLPPV